MALSRDDHLRLRLEQLKALKDHMRAFNGDRIARMKNPPPPEESEEEDDEPINIEHLDIGPHGEEMPDGRPEEDSEEEEGGGAEGGDADSDEDEEEMDADRVAHLAHKRMHRR